MKSHEVERQLFKLVRPEVVLLQVLLQPLPRKLCEHDLSQTNVVDFKAAPQSIDSLHAEVKSHFTDEGRLSTASRT